MEAFQFVPEQELFATNHHKNYFVFIVLPDIVELIPKSMDIC